MGKTFKYSYDKASKKDKAGNPKQSNPAKKNKGQLKTLIKEFNNYGANKSFY